jgi:hypothetical protein
LPFDAPSAAARFEITERVPGSATTDFGALDGGRRASSRAAPPGTPWTTPGRSRTVTTRNVINNL